MSRFAYLCAGFFEFDFALRARELNYSIVYEPSCVALAFLESDSSERKSLTDEHDATAFVERWNRVLGQRIKAMQRLPGIMVRKNCRKNRVFHREKIF
jgi:hypothetical protein